jgi:hypothetical protein
VPRVRTKYVIYRVKHLAYPGITPLLSLASGNASDKIRMAFKGETLRVKQIVCIVLFYEMSRRASFFCDITKVKKVKLSLCLTN